MTSPHSQEKDLTPFYIPNDLNISENVGMAIARYIESVVKEAMSSKSDNVLIQFCSIRDAEHKNPFQYFRGRLYRNSNLTK